MPTLPNVPEPMLARLADRLPTGPGWSYAVKWDGYRCLVLTVGDVVTLVPDLAEPFATRTHYL
jgi:ATP-dependent DNA ligase